MKILIGRFKFNLMLCNYKFLLKYVKYTSKFFPSITLHFENWIVWAPILSLIQSLILLLSNKSLQSSDRYFNCLVSFICQYIFSSSKSEQLWNNDYYRVFSHDVTATMLVSLNQVTVAMLVSPSNLLGMKPVSYTHLTLPTKLEV